MILFYKLHASLLRATLLILLVTSFTRCKKDDIENIDTITAKSGTLSSKQLKRNMLLSIDGVTDRSYYLEDALPEGYVTDGSKDYTSVIQKVLDKYSDIVFPSFPLLVNDKGLEVRSNQSIVFLKGSEIRLEPTHLGTYDIISLEGVENVTLYDPVVIGDRYDHKGDDGEGGIGIAIRGSTNITVHNPNVRACWGDGMYIGQVNSQGHCKNIVINNAFLKRNRRDGISIISVIGLRLESLYAGYSSGTAPSCGINFEANNPESVMKDIVITDPVTMRNEGNGIQMGVMRMLGQGDRSIDVTIINHRDFDSRLCAFKAACTARNEAKDGVMTGSVNVINPTWEAPRSGYPLYFSTNQPGFKLSIQTPNVITAEGITVADDIYNYLFSRGKVGIGELFVRSK
ncbi:MAG: right-handed parallel beta-helix repeat-containing protein [Daejeonella sp.]|nr:right-handed parallel beta-helix repeat-containing protein [Daejeonella sp.]